MKLKFLYSTIFGFFGFLSAFILSWVISNGFFLILYQFYGEKSDCNKLVFELSNAVHLVSFLVILIFAIVKGYNYGKNLEKHKDQVKVKARIKKHCLISLTVFILIVSIGLGFYLKDFFKAKIGQKQHDELVSTLKIVDNFDLKQQERGVAVFADVLGKSDDKYELILELFAMQSASGTLVRLFEDVSLSSDKQTYEFYVPFDDVSESFRQLMGGRLSGFKGKKEFEESINFILTLKLKETPKYSSMQIASLGLPSKFVSGIAYFKFLCDKDFCEVLQDDKLSE